MNGFNFDRVIANLDRVKKTLPKVIGNETQLFFNSSFRNEGWDGNKWQEPKRKDKKGSSSRLRSQTLVQSGTLRRAVARSLQTATWEKISFEVKDVAYGRVHNEGLPMKNGQKMPQRQFMGDSKKLREIQLSKIKSAFDKIWA
jgi:phage gpG-like protein